MIHLHCGQPTDGTHPRRAEADIACRDDRGAVTVGNESPSGKAGSPAGKSGYSRLAFVGAHQQNGVIGDAV